MMGPHTRSLAEYHSRYCALRNKRTSVALVLVSLTLTVVSWRELGRPLSPSPGLFLLVLGHLTAIGMLVEFAMVLRCLRERLVVSLGIVELAIGLVRGLLPSLAAHFPLLIRVTSFCLWAAALGISLTMMGEAFAGPAGHK